MALTEAEQTLAEWLMAFGATRGMAAAILTVLREREDLQEKLMYYMAEHQNATPRELLEQAIEMVS